MEYQFKTFEERPFRRTGTEPHVSIYSNGSFYLNKRSMELLGNPDAVALLYDSVNNVVGIQATPPSRHHAFRLRRTARNYHGHTVRAKSFFQTFKIQPSETLAFRNLEVNKDGILILDMNDAFSVSAK